MWIVIKMEYESSDMDDDPCYVPTEEDDDIRDTDISDISKEEVEAKYVDRWTYIVDLFSDHRKTPVTEFRSNFEIHAPVLLSDMQSPTEYFDL